MIINAARMPMIIRGGLIPYVNTPTREQAMCVITQLSPALKWMKAPKTSSNHLNDRAMMDIDLVTKSKEIQEVIAEVVSDCDMFAAIRQKLQEVPAFQKIVDAVSKMKEETMGGLMLPYHEGLTEDDMVADRNEKPWWSRIFQMGVEAVSSMWNQIADLFAGIISRIQPAFAGEGGAAGDSYALKTAIIITGMVVLVTAFIVVDGILALRIIVGGA